MEKTVPPSWRPVVSAAGSVERLTQILGYKAPSSVFRLARGITAPKQTTLDRLAAFCGRHGIKNPLEAA